MKINPKGRKHHDSNLRKKFGIGLIQYEALLEQQHGKCYLCDEKGGRNLAVDHNHQTGDVRGLLCSQCNQALGLFKDNPDVLRRAAEYVTSVCILPPDVDIEMKPHHTRARWRHSVTTPHGVFDSLAAAGEYYNVHPTTVGYWCGVFKNYKHLQKEGYQSEKVFE